MVDVEALAARVARHLDGRAVACAESCTAGRLSTAFAAVTGAAEWFRGGVTAYQVEVKRELLGVEAPSVLTLEAAAQMASGVAALLDADVAVATTGVAGDEPEDGVPPGTVFFATFVDGEVEVHVRRFEGTPEEVCDEAACFVLAALEDHLFRFAEPVCG